MSKSRTDNHNHYTQSKFMLMLKLPPIRIWCIVCSGFVIGGCAVSPLSLFASANQDVPPPPQIVRQPRLLSVPDDLRLPRTAPSEYNTAVISPFLPGAKNVGQMQASTNQGNQAISPTANNSTDVTSAASTAENVPSAQANRNNGKLASENSGNQPTQLAAPLPLFAPYMPTAVETVPPKTWETSPSHDLPWVSGAVPTRTNEETTMGVGNLLFGRLYARVEFGTAPLQSVVAKAAAQPHTVKEATPGFFGRLFNKVIGKTPEGKVDAPVKKELPLISAAQVPCETITCLDAARDFLVKDAQEKGWQMLLNRRVSLHQSFQFQRENRVVWIEVHAIGKNLLELEYNLMPRQQ